MGYLQTGTPGAFGSVTSFQLTVPAGVAPTDHVLIAVAGVVNVNGADVTATSPGATFTTIAGGAAVFDNTLWGGLIKGTGLTAGNMITVTLSAARQVAAAHYYFDNDFDPPSAFNARVDSATNVAPNVAVTSGAEVFVISLERSTTAGTAISGIVNSHGNSVAALAFNETLTPTLCSLSLTDVAADPADVDSGTTTLTYTNTSTSGLALTIAESVTQLDVDADFSGSGTLTAEAESLSDVDADFSGSGTFDAVVEGFNEIDAEFSGSGELSAAVEGIHVVAAEFGGSGTLTATTEANGVVDVGAPFSGSGELGAAIEPGVAVEALFAGVGELTAEVLATPEVLVLFTGEGELSAAIEQEDVAAMFGGSGTLSATVSAVDGCAWPVPDPECCTEWDAATDEQRQRAINLASEFLWAETGRQFGVCIQTVLPCGLACPCTDGPCHLNAVGADYEMGYGFGYAPALLSSGQITNVSCGGCRCCSPCEIALPGVVDSILNVTVDGETISADAYVVYDRKFLARVDGQCWPECQDFGAAPQFSVTYREGIPVPYPGLQAAADLACALLRLCPDGVDCGSCLAEEATDSTIVATWIKAMNPYGLAQGARLLIPGQPGTEESHRRITWP